MMPATESGTLAIAYPRHGRRSRPRQLVAVRLVREVVGARPSGDGLTTHVRSPRDAHAFLAPFAALEDVETFWVIPLNAQHRVIGCAPVVISRGVVNST